MAESETGKADGKVDGLQKNIKSPAASFCQSHTTSYTAFTEEPHNWFTDPHRMISLIAHITAPVCKHTRWCDTGFH